MCSIVASFNPDKLKELIKLNAYRGTHSHSIATFDETGDMVSLKRSMGDFNPHMLDVLWKPGHYIVAHQQAPTTEARDLTSVHPAVDEHGTMLWHNGIIKADFIAVMQNALNDRNPWDTHLMNRWIGEGKDINDIDGSFACVRSSISGGVQVFRNALSPLFIDDDLNISSTNFAGSRVLPANAVWGIDFANKKLKHHIIFSTKDMFYVDLDDL